ncbi:UNVERIFIED_CONTAM: hypothetical protein BJ099_12736 [Lysinibacillus xylanilyticus]|uniref:hypothetical protein n=1 Tax=Lysinibacillus xylanilyticus TaxID=582475 RepID=UPI000A9472A8|nr:hypothetical protein [Lysinibacillus xylanilyticus]
MEEKLLLDELGQVVEIQAQERINELIPSFKLAFDPNVPYVFSSESNSNIKYG